MSIVKILFFSSVIFYSGFYSSAQTSLLNIRNGLKSKQNLVPIAQNYLFSSDIRPGEGATVNYVQSVVNYFGFHDIEQAFDRDTFGEICQMFTMVGNYRRAQIDNERNFQYGTVEMQKEITEFVKKYHKYFAVTHKSEEYILKEACRAPLVMINEAHDYPFTRVYIMRLLEGLKRSGYSYLAIEALALNGSLNALDQSTGFYTSEPVMGELIRYALRLGYKLVPYEAEVTPEMTSIQRDSIQAKNLISVIESTKDGKLVVIAGYDHINELIIDTPKFQPMAYFVKKWSGLDPLTIEQTNLTECSRDRISRNIYRFLPKQRSSNSSCFKVDEIYYKSFINGRKNQERDIYVVHPRTKYVNGRPTWLDLNGLRKRMRFNIPKRLLKKAILIQAYYAEEIDDTENFDHQVPADQMMFDERKIDFYLTPGNKYILVFRDINNKILERLSTYF